MHVDPDYLVSGCMHMGREGQEGVMNREYAVTT